MTLESVQLIQDQLNYLTKAGWEIYPVDTMVNPRIEIYRDDMWYVLRQDPDGYWYTVEKDER